jgi:methylenetetrahydrofolate reductase (NADPH)
MALRKRRAEELDAAQREALWSLVAGAKFELIPLSNAPERVAELPAGAVTTVTASPSHGIEATVELARALVAAGHESIPHLSAHMIRDRAHLGDLLGRMRDAGIRRAFVVGGDAKDPGMFRDGLSLLRAMEEVGHGLDEIGVPSYPDGHVDIADDELLSVLKEKQRYASYMTTQMCFDPAAIISWIARMRAEGVTLPVHIGTPGVAELAKLMAVSARIGVADSARYLRKNRKLVGGLLSPGRYGPDALLRGLAPAVVDPAARIEALHVFTFNQVVATVEWQRRMLASLDEASAQPGS